jgi:hypothetical protein
LRRQLAYKTAWYGSALVVAGRFYPSSKTCSQCRQVIVVFLLGRRVGESVGSAGASSSAVLGVRGKVAHAPELSRQAVGLAA